MRPLLLLLLAVSSPALHAQALELYAGDRFGGERLVLDAASTDLGGQRFAARTGSLVVQAGRWELCTEREHRGTCVVFGPGRYDLLPGALAQRVVSVRPVQVVAAAAAPVAPAGDQAPVTLYQDAGWQGRAVPIGNTMAHLSDVGFNDEASSIEVRFGRWQLCANADFGPPCQVFGPGRHGLGGALHDGASSIRPVYGPGDRPLPAAGGVVLYQDAGWQGRALLRTGATPSLRDLDFNDDASSIEVLAGRWELCSDADYGGTCRIFGPGRHGLEGALHDGVSSLRPR